MRSLRRIVGYRVGKLAHSVTAMLIALALIVSLVPYAHAVVLEVEVTVTGGELKASIDQTDADLGYQYIIEVPADSTEDLTVTLNGTVTFDEYLMCRYDDGENYRQMTYEFSDDFKSVSFDPRQENLPSSTEETSTNLVDILGDQTVYTDWHDKEFYDVVGGLSLEISNPEIHILFYFAGNGNQEPEEPTSPVTVTGGELKASIDQTDADLGYQYIIEVPADSTEDLQS